MLKLWNMKKDEIVESLVEDFQKRSEFGIRKYGTTLKENNKDDFLQHALEEAMDFCVYIKKIQDILHQKGYKRIEDVPECSK